MTIDEIRTILDEEWIQEEGYFFYDLKFSIFNEERFEFLRNSLTALRNEEIDEIKCFDKRFIEVLWYIPIYMRWQIDNHNDNIKHHKQLLDAIEYFEERLTTILGVP